MNPLVAIDRWLIEKIFEPFTFRFEALTGVNNFALARYILVIWPAAAGAYALGETARPVVNFASAIVALTTSTVEFFNLQMQERMTKSGLANMERFGLWWILHRWIWNVLFITAWLHPGVPAIFAIGLSGYWFQGYLRACNRMPPKFKEDWGASRKGRLAPLSSR